MRRLYLFGMMAAATLLYSCHKDTEIEYRDVIVHDTVTIDKTVTEYVNAGQYFGNKPLLIDRGDTVIISYGDINVGNVDDDVVFGMTSTIMTPHGKDKGATINCIGIGAAVLVEGEGGGKRVDMSAEPTNVTIVNRGTITVHTKDLYEKFKADLWTRTDTLKYEYLRVLPLYVGKNSKVINEGIINVYFDHDETSPCTVYTMALVAGDGGQIVNSGEIHFYGKGSNYTRMRGVATFANNITVVNDGIMTAEVEMAEDSRGITTGGTLSNVINNGTIDFKLPGTLFGMTRFGNSNIVNNGKIHLTSLNRPAGLEDNFYQVAGIYEPISGATQNIPTGLSTIINRGDITIDISGDGVVNTDRTCFGIYLDVQAGTTEVIKHFNVNITNDSLITINNFTGNPCKAAELGGISRIYKEKNVKLYLSVGNWKTKIRDFKTDNLFYGTGVNMNLGASKFTFLPGEKYTFGTPCSVSDFLAGEGNELSPVTSANFEATNANYPFVFDETEQTITINNATPVAK